MAASRPVLGERRMSDVEALMWNLEKDPYLASSFANVTLLDQPPDPDRLRARLAHAVSVVPRLRQRVAPALGRLAPPEWQDDPNFDLDYHIRHIALASAGNRADAVRPRGRRSAAAPLDRTRPLWEFTIIDGVGDGAALFQKIHHTVTDGEGGVRMSAEFIDFSREGTPDEPPTAVRTDGPRPHEDAEPPANIFATASETAAHNLRRGLGLGRRAAEGAVDLLAAPGAHPGRRDSRPRRRCSRSPARSR